MGAEDARRQRLNVFRMRMLGRAVHEVDSGSRTLKDATNEAMRDWMGSVGETHYILGSVVGPHPFPWIVREFQSVIGKECREQCLNERGRLPEAVVACVGGGSNAAGIFHPFLSDEKVRLIGVEAGGRGPEQGEHVPRCLTALPRPARIPIVCTARRMGQTADVHSCSAGLITQGHEHTVGTPPNG